MKPENKIYDNVLKALETIGEDIEFFSIKFKECYGDEIVDWDGMSIQTARNICDLLALGSLESFQYEYNKRAHEVLFGTNLNVENHF